MPKKYKALVVDFDNTLVGRDFVISQSLEKSIREIRGRGVIFSIATGRGYFGRVRDVCCELGLVAPQIAFGGAEIYDPRTDLVLWAKYMPTKEVEAVINFLRRLGVFFGVQKEDSIYTIEPARLEKAWPGLSGVKLKRLPSLEVKNVPKIFVSATVTKLARKQAEEIEDKLRARFKDLTIIMSRTVEGYYGLDITSGKASKHIAVLELSKLLEIKPAEMVGVGDSYNDYPLLTACGAKVAMGDAPRELKEIADFIAPPQKEDGLVEVIEKYFAEV